MKSAMIIDDAEERRGEVSGETAPDAVLRQFVVTGILAGFSEREQLPLVVFPGQPGSAAIPARSILDVRASHVGCDALLVFEGGDPRHPVIVGFLRDGHRAPNPQPGSISVDVDGERLVVAAKDQLRLCCGNASITLTKAGKVLIEGTYVSSHSSGVNRVKGGSVQIN